MTRWRTDLPKPEYVQGQGPTAPQNIRTLELEPFIRALKDQKLVAIDTETTGLDHCKDYPLYASVAWTGRRITLHASVLPWMKEVLADSSRHWTLAMAKFDMHMLANCGTPIQGLVYCIQVMHSLLFGEMSHKLKDMADQLLGYTWSDFQTTFGKISKKGGVTAEDVIRRAESQDQTLLIEYASLDAWGTWELYWILKAMLESEKTYSLYRRTYPYIETLADYYYKVEAPYTKVLWDTERAGVLIDMEKVGQIGPKVLEDLQKLDREFSKIIGFILNVNSPSQLRHLFYDPVEEGGMGLVPNKLTKGGKKGIRLPSVDANALERLAQELPIADMILKYRDLAKLHSTYIANILRYVDSNGRVHTTYNQDIVRTGRLSSKEPALQTIPNLENDRWGIRSVFIAPDGCVLIVVDYQQLEMKLLACAANDKRMQEVFLKGWDIHMGNASLMYNIPYEDFVEAKRVDKLVKKEELPRSALTDYMAFCLKCRYEVKSTSYGLNYGMGVTKLSIQLECLVDKAKELKEKYLKTYPAVKDYFETAKRNTRRLGYSYTILGRRRALPEINSSDKYLRSSGERRAINNPIQGSAADIMKMAQILCSRASLEAKYGCRMLLQIHDELVFECPKETAEEALAEIISWMEHPLPTDLAIPLTVDAGTGRSWAEGH